jgi:hypothetical protein
MRTDCCSTKSVVAPPGKWNTAKLHYCPDYDVRIQATNERKIYFKINSDKIDMIK